MHNHHRHQKITPGTGAFRMLVNGFLMLALLVSTFGVAMASSNQAALPEERFAEDPYAAWGEAFLDFIPPNPEKITLNQPDGSTLQALLTPMETGGLLETLDGYTVIQDVQGWWNYANDQLVPSGLIPGRDVPAGLAKKVGQHESIWLDSQGNDKRDPIFDAVRDVQSPNASIFQANTAAVKNYHYIVIMTEFQDVKFEAYQTPQYFKDQISGLGTSPTGTVSDLYFEMSYGQFLPDFEVVGPFTLPGDMYAYDYQIGGKSVTGQIADISPQLQALGADWWDQFDNDRVVSGSTNQYRTVDMVVVLHAGPGKEATGQPGQVWSHASNASTTNAAYNMGITTADGRPIRIRAANTVPAIGFNIGVVAHEMGHSIGESDYYDTNYRSQGSGDYDLMAGGSWMGNDPAGSNPTHMNPYSKVRQGWVTTTPVTATTLGVVLPPRSVAPAIIEIPLGGTTSGSCTGAAGQGADERVYVEHLSNRVPGAIFDKAVYASGLLIWHYDRCGSNNKSATAPARYRMGVQEYDFRDGTQELQLNLNRGEPTDVWWDTALGMTPNTTPGTNRNTLLAGATSLSTGWYLMNISDIGGTMSLDLVQEADVQDLVGVDRPELLNQPVIVGTGPATLSTKVYNLTTADLLDVKVEFWATIGAQQVKLAETTLATLPFGAPTVATAAWATPVTGKWHITAKASVAGHVAATAGMARVFPRSAAVLIVDDDDGYTSEEAFEGALTSLGVPYTLVEKTASLALLQQYELVIWSAGQAGRYQGQLNLQEIADLKAYLDAGGKLWMSSPRLANALGSGSSGASSGVDPAFLHDYFGASYPMSSQAGGGTITGLGEWIGGMSTINLRQFPGRAIEDYLDPAVSAVGTVTPLFSWSFGHHLGMQVQGDAAHNDFQVVYFGFNLSQVILGSDRLTLTQQVLDEMGISSVYFDMSTYLMQRSGAVKLTLRDLDAVAPVVTVRSQAQPAGVTLVMKPAGLPGDFVGVLNVQKTSSSGGALKVNDVDVLTVEYQDAPGHMIWSTANVLLKQGKDLPAVVYHDLIYIATDAQDLPVMAVVTDDIRVQKVDLYYRVAGSPTFILVPLQMTDNSAYTALIPASAVTPLGVEYYLLARDSKGTLTYVGTSTKPNFVVVQPRTLGMP